MAVRGDHVQSPKTKTEKCDSFCSSMTCLFNIILGRIKLSFVRDAARALVSPHALLPCPFSRSWVTSDSDEFAAYCVVLPLLGIGPEWWMDSHNIHHVVCNDVKCGESRTVP